jgi:putative redox protein
MVSARRLRYKRFMSKSRVKWVDGMTFVGESASGHGVVMDASPEVGGRDLGTRPMEMVILGLGGCTSIDVLMILKKQRQQVTDCWVEIEAERRDEVPKVYSRIHSHFVVTGVDLDERKVERAIQLSAEKYCSVAAMLEKTAEMTHDFEIIEADAEG